jgi:hypothetical protein
LSRIIRGERGVTADMALRLAACWGTSARYWMNLQALYELDVAQRINPAIASDVRPLDRYAARNGNFVLVVLMPHAAIFRPTAWNNWLRSSTTR